MVFGSTPESRGRRQPLIAQTQPAEDDGNPFGDLLHVFANLDISVKSLTQAMQEQRAAEQQALRDIPRNVALAKMSSPGLATTDIQDFGGPQNGREWDVLLLTAFASPLAANAAVVTWYVGQNSGGPAAGMLPSTMVRWQFPSVPNQEDFGPGVVKVRNGERLIAGLTNIPNNSNIGLVAVINDQPLYGGVPVAAV